MSNASKYDFRAWLETKNPDETYRFSDGCGACLMGQFMASRGEEWTFGKYINYVDAVLDGNVSVLSVEPQSMGGALERIQKILEEV